MAENPHPVRVLKEKDLPANLTPQYLKAEEEFRAAQTVEEKVAALKVMMRLMPSL